MSDADSQWATMVANLQARTGRSLDGWVKLVRAEGLEKHGQIITFLKTEHGMTHGYANLVATHVRDDRGAPDEDLVAAQYAGPKAGLRPIYEAVLAAATGLGPDVEVAPKKTYVSLRRRKQFALVKAATRSEVEVGFNLPGEPGTGRLRPATGMCSHTVRLASTDELDGELRAWLAAAYERA